MSELRIVRSNRMKIHRIIIDFRLSQGAFAQKDATQTKSSVDSNGSSTNENKSVIVSTRLRQTDKRLRKIHSSNTNLNEEKNKNVIKRQPILNGDQTTTTTTKKKLVRLIDCVFLCDENIVRNFR